MYKSRRYWRATVTAAALILGVVSMASAQATKAAKAKPKATAKATGHFKVTAPDLASKGRITLPHVFNGMGCNGQNISPALQWSNPPAGTMSFAMIMYDPEGLDGLGAVHWVAYGIPASVTGFAEGEVSVSSDKYVGGKSFGGSPHYFGPCTPPGDYHHYTFTLIATDLDPKALEPGLTRDQLFERLKGHTKGAAGLIGRFTKP